MTAPAEIISDNPQTQNDDVNSTPSFSWLRHIIIWGVAILFCAGLATLLFIRFHSPEHPGGYFVIVCLYAVTASAALHDAALRRIPNTFNYTALILALALNMIIAPLCELMGWNTACEWIGANTGWGGVAFESLKGFGLCLAIGVISFAARGLGGGDVKLLSTVGVLAGWNLSLSILLNTLCVALAMGLANLVFRGSLIRTLQIITIRLYLLIKHNDFKTPITFKPTESPFCLSLLIGLILLPFINTRAYLFDFLDHLMK